MRGRDKPSILRGKVRELLQAHADAVVRSVLDECKVSEYHYRKSNFKKHALARALVIRRLYADGFSHVNISRLTGMNETTVATHLSSRVKARRQAYQREREASIRQEIRA